ncbi:UDP-N-acetylglucosamine 2-epimerase (non-hydrolyzing) [Sphingomonas sp. BE123]|jgi:UDP-N-acetylglucosamine 2-epimerase (non-hydrolysing)|uniref:non-hydrolyzing UDP-N-acetylglucosamine 2-epimerase n=1 Tax=Sphingomonas sp. BE123 TaxID=2817842 RepID=UPI002863B9B6|nr:UDP-N-acetylglucosamine 2-epimerase (non-hydrolyzing) [Sphingomonas sp. BE123]MDR6851825.1 UDP-N-acetylglucosamine 2-epimerase (non-hydrolyzing) [Sphingomonas sp. BE123]
MTQAEKPRVLVIFGTRPEAIKLFPVIDALRACPQIELLCCVTGQHRELLHQVLDMAGIVPDIDLGLMQPGQSLDALTARLLLSLGEVMDQHRPSRVIVQGDTATAMVGALAAYYRRIPVSHVEAGLRSGNLYHPWPEEANRKMIGAIADQHFAPTETSAAALRAENVDPATIHVTGNTVIDALHAMRARIAADPALAAGMDDLLARAGDRRIIVVTTHRRENFGGGMEAIGRAIARIAARGDTFVAFPIHPNPNVRAPMHALLSGRDNVAIIDPLDYPNFVRLLAHSHIVLTDSGGVQEEAPGFGKPVLVMRDTTERPEGVVAGTARLIGTQEDAIVAAVETLLDDAAAYGAMARAHNPFGDGKASGRIVKVILDAF